MIVEEIMDFQCKRCGACCRDMMVAYETNGKDAFINDTLRLLNMRKGMEAVRDGRRIIINYKTVCKHLTKENLCDCYDRRPVSCRAFRCDKWDRITSLFSEQPIYASRQKPEDEEQ